MHCDVVVSVPGGCEIEKPPLSVQGCFCFSFFAVQYRVFVCFVKSKCDILLCKMCVCVCVSMPHCYIMCVCVFTI